MAIEDGSLGSGNGLGLLKMVASIYTGGLAGALGAGSTAAGAAGTAANTAKGWTQITSGLAGPNTDGTGGGMGNAMTRRLGWPGMNNQGGGY